MMFGVGRHTTLIVHILFKTLIFQRIGKKNNQSSVTDADREIPTLGSTDNVGKEVKSNFSGSNTIGTMKICSRLG